MNKQLDLSALRFDKDRGTVVVVAQDAATGRVLMVANADREALERTEGVQTQAAELLRMSFRSFRYYAKKAGLKGGD